MLGFWKIVVVAAIVAFTASAANAKVYLFHVSCADGAYVAQWDSAPVDLGEDHFRLATGDVNFDCSIYDYDAKADRDLPRRWCSDIGGIIRGFPPALILAGMTHCQ